MIKNRILPTSHGSQRLKQRCKVKVGTKEVYLEQVRKFGITYEETYGILKEYLDKIQDKFTRPTFLIFNRKIFVLSKSNTLITVFDLKSKYFNIVRLLEKGKLNK